MGVVTQEYLRTLPPIYRDILTAFPKLEPSRKAGYALAYQTLYEELRDRYSFDEIVAACEAMAQGGAVEIKQRIFVHPTDVGEDIIAGLTGKKSPESRVPPFPPPAKG
jgi:hypothetical protein